MLVCHLPAGYIAAKITEKKFWKDLPLKEKFWLYSILLFFSIFPDIDLLYFYLVNSSTSHREFITHAISPYLLISSLIYLWGKFKKNKFIKWIGISIALGTITHLILDSLMASAEWLWPITSRLYGLPMIKSYFNFLAVHTFSLYFIFETLVICLGLSFYLWGKNHKKSSIFISFILAIISGSLIYAFHHRLYRQADIYNQDLDKDGIVNGRDSDIDNDGIENIIDRDANNNGISNDEEITNYAREMEGIYCDPLNNKMWNRIFSLGFLNASEILIYSLEKAGIYLHLEIKNDITLHPEIYDIAGINNAKKYEFYEKTYNIYKFFKSKKMLICNNINKCRELKSELKKGDILFYDGQFSHLAIIIETNGSFYNVIESEKYYNRSILLDNYAMERYYGEPTAISRLP